MYKIIVIGGGHAGSEACLASARLGHKTLLVTGNIDLIASMPCNPSVGGPAKGIVVREIDALGGEMAKNADKTQIQMRLLNISKGPAVRALRAQSDKVLYSSTMKETILNQDNLDVKEAYVKHLYLEENQIKGIILESGEIIKSETVILTTGTYMEAKVLLGSDVRNEGPMKQKASNGLSEQLRSLGFKTTRLKTGTPPRVDTSTIDFSQTEIHEGDKVIRHFSFDKSRVYDVEKQWPCHLTYTSKETHDVIMNNLHKSSMYGGEVEGVGPRYCPSIEDKYVRFKDKPRHQIFLEPESTSLNETYVQGLSTSMPKDVQKKMIQSLPGLKQAKIIKYGYAIEYDAIDPRVLYPTLESKDYQNLYFGGQVNGTSGYEEAACQGLMASINAVMKLEDKEPLILKRNEAYIGVLIDDLVTKGVKDPYRLLTSRAEYRLLLRHDNADIRLREHGRRIGLLDDKVYREYKKKQQQIIEIKETLEIYDLYPNEKTNKRLNKLGTTDINNKTTLYKLLRRPEISIELFTEFLELDKYSEDALEQAEIDIKYEGYIKKAKKQAKKMLKMEDHRIPRDIDYNKIHNLALEAKEKLKQIKPLTIGQASRISGVNPADVSILVVYLKGKYNS
ncbi:MAG: tRNA uridine-5-carboxymethylaminomethyl(34) synthesis enzyme MnmG [Candidatus Izimaplasma sp.]|nr:tRNA uridine-5-carboxymethylaminomethyl(34) synthesis enzyme MnmG [Candidatus Izimaplasma bacterium]